MDWTTLVPWMCGSLQATGPTTLGNWTETELFQYAEEALHEIGARYLLVAVFDDFSIALVANQPLYDLPDHHIVTIFAAADGTNLQATEVSEMEALDDQYETAASANAPTRWIANALGLNHIRVYPPKNATGVFQMVYQQKPPDMPVPAVTVPPTPLNLQMPAAVADYLLTRSLEKARRRQGDGQLIDAADALNVVAQTYEKAIAAYWGTGE